MRRGYVPGYMLVTYPDCVHLPCLSTDMAAFVVFARLVSWLRFCPLLVACHGCARFLCLSARVAAFVSLADLVSWLRSRRLLL